MRFNRSHVPSSDVLKIPEAKEIKIETQVCVFKKSLSKWDYFLVLSSLLNCELLSPQSITQLTKNAGS